MQGISGLIAHGVMGWGRSVKGPKYLRGAIVTSGCVFSTNPRAGRTSDIVLPFSAYMKTELVDQNATRSCLR